jgi:hypothetical protein
MSALSVYHVHTSDRDSYCELIGVCAANQTDAARIVVERLTGDGAVDVKTSRIERVASQGAWTPGNTLIYR